MAIEAQDESGHGRPGERAADGVQASPGRFSAGTAPVGTAPTGRASLGVAPAGIPALLWSRLRQAMSEPVSSGTCTVLDCGGGSGSLAVPLAVAGAEVTVVDISIDALSTLLRRATEAGVAGRVHAVQGDVEQLSDVVTAGSYGLVLAHGLLESVSDRALVLHQIARVLEPGGVASLLVANPVAAVLSRLLSGEVSAALHSFRRAESGAYGLPAALDQCEQAGLSVESVEGVGVFSEFVPGIVQERPGVLRMLAELEEAAAAIPPYRDIASHLHLLARRDADAG